MNTLIDQGEPSYISDAGASGGTPPYTYQWLVSVNNPIGTYTTANANATCGKVSTTLNCSFITNYTSTPPGVYYFEIKATDAKGLTATSGYVVVKVNPHLVPIPTPTVVNSPIIQGQQLLIATDTMPSPLNGTPPYTYLWLVAYNGSKVYTPASVVECLATAGPVIPGESLYCFSTTATPTGNYTYKVEVIDSADPQNSISDNSTPAIVTSPAHGSTSSTSTTLNTTTSSTTIKPTTSTTTANTTSTIITSTQKSSTSTLLSSTTASSTTTGTTTTSTICPIGFVCAPSTSSMSTSSTTTICIPGINCVTSTVSTTTISGGGGGGGGTGGGGGAGGGGGGYAPSVECRQNGGLYCTATNITQYATFSVNLCKTQINVTENYITPIYAGITINNRQYALYLNNKTLLDNVGPYFYVELVNISYLPIIQTIRLNFSATQCPVTTTIPPVNQTNTSTSISTVRTTTLRTTIFIPFISSITSSTTVAASIIIAILIIIILILLIFFIMRKRKEEKEEQEARKRQGGGQQPPYNPPSPGQLRK